MKLICSLLATALALSACSSPNKSAEKPAEPAPAPASAPLPKTLEEAVASDSRTPEYKKRDIYRHPVETLNFFGIKPDMTVIEILPATGWYTEILAPYLSSSGKYFAAIPKGKVDPKLAAWMEKNPSVKITVTDFSLSSNAAEAAPAGSADMVLTFRNVHNWMNKKSEKAAFAAFFKALKSGGTLGVVEHRADPKKKSGADGHLGYVPEKTVMALAKGAGFKFVGKSEINANPKDLKDYPEGVWTLPPTLKLGDKDRDRFLAIGESDRMTMKFVKPDR